MTSKFLLHLMKTVCSKKRFSSISTQHLRIRLSCLMLDLVLKMNWAWCPFSAPPLYHVSLRAQDFYIILTLKWPVYILSPLPPHVEKAMAPHSSTLAWKIPWTEEHGGPQSMGSLRVGHDWATSLSCIGEGNGNPLQCSCLENPRDGGASWAAVYGVTESWTRLKRLSSYHLMILSTR